MPNLQAAATATSTARIATPRPARRLSGMTSRAAPTPTRGKRKRMASVDENSDDSDFENTPKPSKRANTMTPSKRKLDLQRIQLEKREADLERKAKELDDRELEVVEREDELGPMIEAPSGDMNFVDLSDDVRDDMTELET